MIILAVTESSATQNQLRALLAGRAELVIAATVEAAQRHLASIIPELLFCEFNLPDGCALDVLGHATHTHCPHVVLHNTHTPATDIEQAIQAGVLDCVNIETVTPSEFSRLLLRAKSHRRMLQEAQDAAHALHDKEEFNFALFQHNPAAMVVVDLEGNVIKSNLAMRHLRDQLPALGEPLYTPTRDSFSANMATALTECIQSGSVRAFPELQHGDSHLSLTMAPVPRGAVVIMEDISERVLAQEESARRQEQLIHADKMIALGTLVSGVAHEISNPNNVMLLSAKALDTIAHDLIPVLDHYQELEGDFYLGAQPYADLRDEISELTGSTLRAAEKIRTLVGDLKTFARPDADTLGTDVNINLVVEAAISLVGSLIRQSTTHFVFEKGNGIPTLSGNAQRLEQVIINLIGNACQALSHEDASIRIVTRYDSATTQAVVEVCDEGEGIPPDNLKRIQDPFFTTKHDTGGTGLGLSISSKIIAAHDGTLTFESEWGHGTTARISIPTSARKA